MQALPGVDVDATGDRRAPPVRSTATSWTALLRLRFDRDLVTARTLVRREHMGPLLVQRPFYPEPEGTCHVYLIHPPGGVVGGDSIRLEATVESGAESVITTPGATKYYRSAGPEANVYHHLFVARGGSLEWLPQESIAFSGARVNATTRVDLAEGARFFGWEILCLGRPAAGERFGTGFIRPRFELRLENEVLLFERGSFEAGGRTLSASWGLDGQAVVATLTAVGAPSTVANALRTAVSCRHCTVTELRGVLVARYLGPSAAEARDVFRRAWAAVRPAILGRAPVEPRIWAT